MIAFIFVSIICVGNTCEFMTSKFAMPNEQCQKIRKQFEALPFKPNVTLTASQCMEFRKDIHV